MTQPLLPFNWVQQYQVLLLPDATLCFHPKSSTSALFEARRYLPQSSLMPLDEAAFSEKVAEVYQQNSRSAELFESLGSEFDLDQAVQHLPEDNDLLDSDDGAPVIRLINAILTEAIKQGASDIHIEPFEKVLSVRFRIDGMLRPVLSPPVQLSRYLLSRIKVMARLDIAEKRVPQDGRISLRLGGRNIDVRVSTLPAQHGERIVLRVLDKNGLTLSLAAIGMTAAAQREMARLLHSPHGILLVTGPTGSGKSTTLYAGLKLIHGDDKNIMTIEDPVEYELEGIGQTQVNSKIDMTFARGLRAILRQDPDVVMIGEIRDSETAQIAVQASLTGHLVLSTLHTNSALGAIERLRDMGVEPFLLASSLLGVLSQRLVRRLCQACRQPVAATAAQLSYFPSASSGLTLWQAVGCERCHHSGYRGRIGIHELLIIDDSLRRAISHPHSEQPLHQLVSADYQSLQQDGLQKAQEGVTTLEEILRVTRNES